MRSLKYIPNHTVSDYRQWEGHWELINGMPFAMTPSPTKKHQLIAKNLVFTIETALTALKDKCGSCEIVYELDWIVDDNTVLRPDIAVICDDYGDFISKAPALIIEILSPSTAIKDRHVKFEIYEEQKVPYYIIVDIDRKSFNIFVWSDGRYEEQNHLNTFSIGNGQCAFSLNLSAELQKP